MKKSIVVLVTMFTLLLSTAFSEGVHAEEAKSPSRVSNVDPAEIYADPVEGTIKPEFIMDFRNIKKNVKKSTGWSKYKRISDNIKTGKAGGSITANKTVTFGTTSSGDIRGLTFGFNVSKSSAKGYTLNVGPNKRVYMGYRVNYNIEKGENWLVDIVTGKVMDKTKYTHKKPRFGEYGLINYK
ncbi:hypothetical protein C6W20_18755 [Bacillus sp. NMCN6]|uniref:hypothetical protein n=1 Tax=Bacillus sp. NMCN6 TaxID=2108535 RepID=UPI000D02794F|nr:hypothetical protein [Bacillus sp. NMCN6]PRR95134.1 hypothetical protein C6W20_18755 [Bacillus sp. NMCN6]